MLLDFLYLLTVDFNPDDRLRLTLLKVYLKVAIKNFQQTG